MLRHFGSSVAPSLFAIAFAVTYAALIFTGPLQPLLAHGVTAALIAGAIGCFVLSSTSGFKPLIAGPEGTTVALLASMIGSLTPTLAAIGQADALKLTMVVLALATFVSAIFQFGIGHARLGRLVRYIPYPVVAGFLGSTAWLLVSGASRMATDVPIGPELPSVLMTAKGAFELILTIIWATVLWWISRRFRSPLTTPAALIVMTFVTHALLVTYGISPEEARAHGVLFDRSGGGQLELPWFQVGLFDLNLDLPFEAICDIVAAALLSIVAILLNSTGIEVATRTEIDLDRELKWHGIANLATAPFCGLITNVSISRTLACRATGGTDRISGLIVGGILATVALSGFDLSSWLPRFVLSGLLLLLGVENIWEWVVRSYKRLPLSEWLTVVAIIALTAGVGTIWGLLFGITACCIILTIDVGRIEVIRGCFGLDEQMSSRQRPAEEIQVLARIGHQVQVVSLTGFIFFGSTHRIYERVKMIVAEKEPQVLIFDFSRVKGIDSSAAATFAKIVIFLNGADIEIIATGGGANVREMLLDVEINSRFSDAFMPVDYSLDEALEHWEDQLLMSSKVDVSATFSITNWMGSALGSDEYAKALTQALTRRDIAAGEYICRQGDSTDALLFIESGRVSVLLEELDTPIRRLRVFGPRTIVGEIGFFFNQKRTATLRSDKPTTIWALDHQAFVHLRDTQPAITSSLLIYIIAQQSERLTYTSRQIAALSR